MKKRLFFLIITALSILPAAAEDFFYQEVQQPEIEWDKPPAALQNKNAGDEIDIDIYPEININYAQTSVPAISAFLNQQQNEYLADASPEKAFSRENAAEAGASSAIPSPETFSKWANQFAKEQWSDNDKDAKDEAPLHFSVSSIIHYQGHYKNLELFAIESDTYQGMAAHGINNTNYYVFTDQGKRLFFGDILISPDKLAAIQPLLKPGMAAYAKENEADIDTILFSPILEKPKGDENFTFTPEGIKILYQPYEIAPYSAGMPYTVLPYQKLKGIVKEQYLP